MGLALKVDYESTRHRKGAPDKKPHLIEARFLGMPVGIHADEWLFNHGAWFTWGRYARAKDREQALRVLQSKSSNRWEYRGVDR